MRKRYTPQFKAKVVREILREEKSISQPSAEYGVHATQLRNRKKRTPEKLPDLFAGWSWCATPSKNIRDMSAAPHHDTPSLSAR